MQVHLRRLGRWIGSTSNRTFVLWPALLLLVDAVARASWPQPDPWAAPLLAWGYLQYRWVGRWRQREGGGGPGLSNPPLRIVSRGPYALVRNPMYLGHLIFFLGLALAFSGPAWLLFVAHVLWFERRVRQDEARLGALFGADYAAYTRRVKRWLPGLY